MLFSFGFRVDENPQQAEPVWVRARSEQSAKDFSLEETKFRKRKSVDTFNASDSRQSTPTQILIKTAFAAFFIITFLEDYFSEI